MVAAAGRSEVRPERYDAYDVVWRSRSGDASGSMPVGNGDTGCNVWVTEAGRIECRIGKTDAFSELNSLLKVGGLSVAMTPNLLAGGEFEQRLNIRDGVVEISGSNSDGAVSLRFWVDAHAPVIRLEGEASVPVKVEVRNTTWRREPREISGLERHAIYGLYDAPFATRLQADTLLHSDVGMAWAHRNGSSIYLLTLQNQNLADWYDPADDPLLHRTFGALVCGPGMHCEAPTGWSPSLRTGRSPWRQSSGRGVRRACPSGCPGLRNRPGSCRRAGNPWRGTGSGGTTSGSGTTSSSDRRSSPRRPSR